MAWATKCDRCGDCFEHHQDETNAFAFLSYGRPTDKYYVDGKEYDLCPECVHSLKRWFRGPVSDYAEGGDDYDG